MIYQYRKFLAEEWYSQKMFWILSFVVYLFTIVYSLIKDTDSKVEIGFNFAFAILNFILICLLLKTKPKSTEFPKDTLMQG